MSEFNLFFVIISKILMQTVNCFREKEQFFYLHQKRAIAAAPHIIQSVPVSLSLTFSERYNRIDSYDLIMASAG